MAVISYDYWQSHYGADPGAVGARLRANDHILTIVGVAPRTFQGSVLGLSFDIWVPATMSPLLFNSNERASDELEDRASRGWAVMGRLATGVTRAQATDEVATVMRGLAAAYPRTNGTVTGEVLPFFDAPRGPQRFFASALWFLQAVMLLLLLTVCGNTANLVLARASTRHREMGVRLALGARPWRIVRLMALENLLMALAGAGLGVFVAMWGTDALRAVPMTAAFPVKFQTHVDTAAVLFAAGLGAVSSAIFGAAPAWQLATVNPLDALRAGAKGGARNGLRHALMAVQVALAVLLLVVAGLFYRGFADSKTSDPGFRTEGVLLAAYDLTGQMMPGSTDDATRARTFVQTLLARLRENPAVDGAAVAASVPLDIHGLPSRSFVVEGRARSDGRRDESLSNIVTPGYFAALGIPLIEGRDFASLDEVAAPRQVIVNESFRQKYLADTPALGHRIESGGRDYTVAGVVKTTTSEAFDEPPTPAIYFSYRDRVPGSGEIHLTARPGLEDTLASFVASTVRGINPELPVYNVRTMTAHIDRNLVLRKIPARMFVVLGPLLLALAGIGIYAVVAYTVSQRTTEIGVRMALGATSSDVVRAIAWDSLRIVLMGGTVGWLLAFLIEMHVVRGGWRDLPVLIGVPVALLAVALLACWIPARRASHTPPSAALRERAA